MNKQCDTASKEPAVLDSMSL